MHYTQRTLDVLEYDKIRLLLSEVCATEGARRKALSLMPSDDFEAVYRRQERTAAAKRLLSSKGYPAFAGDEEVVSASERAEKGAVLNPRELLHIAALFRTARSLIDYISVEKNYTTCLDERFLSLVPNRPLETKIAKIIPEADLIADDATPELHEIRRKIKAANNRIKDTLQAFVAGARSSVLQENLVTMRDGRYVIPVKSEHRNEIRGLIHDTSASGATVFVEPMGVVDANNELRLLLSAEEREIERILALLSAEVGDAASAISYNYRQITDLAFYFACATLAVHMRAVQPVLLSESLIDLRRARHPLLNRETVVPIDISLGEAYRTLVITGPNTGGKTVSLKTLGIFSLMAQSGLQIPAEEGSRMGIFSEILVDLGDEQSIEQSLSTFSSHMVNIVDILSHVGKGSLVLFDELGGGTDPIEGASLAIAILEKVREMGALSAATTHYAELKAYALDTEGVQNASCEFDIESLKPTYRLIVGAPGKSNAFLISEKLGLSAEVIEAARAMVSGENKRFENVIEKLENSRVEMEKNRRESERLRREYESFKSSAEEALKRRLSEKEKEIEKEREKAHQLLISARAASDFVLKELEEIKKAKDKKDFAEQLNRTRGNIRARLREQEDSENEISLKDISLDEKYVLPRPLRVGDKVYIVPYQQEGYVEETKDKKNLVAVRAGIMRAKLPEDALRLLIEKKTKKEAPRPESLIRKTVMANFSPELDVRGMYGDDAWFMVDKYLDDAVLSGMTTVRIIHGKGTGALRKVLTARFKNDPRVKEFRSGVFGEGDTGVTVVTMK